MSTGVKSLEGSPKEDVKEFSEYSTEEQKEDWKVFSDESLINDPDTSNSSCNGHNDQSMKDPIHENVIPDKAWSVTSVPDGYECVDAMFMVEAEGTCMLQQEIPIELESENQQLPEEQIDVKSQSHNNNPSPLVQDVRLPWTFPLLPSDLEAEEEKEMMEQKQVLEHSLLRRTFFCISSDTLDGSDIQQLEDEEVVIIGKQDPSQACPDTPTINIGELRKGEAQVVCH